MAESKQNPLIDTGMTTVNAFNAIRNKEGTNTSFILGKDDTTVWKSPNFKVKVKAWTQVDKQTHTYFHSLSIDVNVDDFMGTAELKCPYDSDLMEYWEPIRQTVVIYGANKGDYKILFIGRVRELKQDGYELVITFQNYGWKFKQMVTQSYAKDNVLKKDGYTIMRLMFEALKIDSYVISESAKNRLKQVGIDEDGNLTVNGKEVKKVPDLLKRLKASDPSKLVNKKTLNDKLREKYLHNIKNINYTLKYEKPTPVMKKISSQGSYSAGSNIYQNAYGSASGGSGGGSGGSSGSGTSGSCKSPPAVKSYCPNVPSSLWDAFTEVWLYNHDCRPNVANAYSAIVNWTNLYAKHYFELVDPCLATMAKYPMKNGKTNGAYLIRNKTYGLAQEKIKAVSGGGSNVVSKGISMYNWAAQTLNNIGNNLHTLSNNLWNMASNAIGSLFKGG